MHIDADLLPIFIQVLEQEEELANIGQSAYSDHNGMVYLSEAIEKMEARMSTGLDHSEYRVQVWNTISSLIHKALSVPALSSKNHGKIVKLILLTNLDHAQKEIEDMIDERVQENIEPVADWLTFLLRFSDASKRSS